MAQPSIPDSTASLEVRRGDLGSSRVVREPLPALERGQALLRIERFGLTANNVTYGVTGDTLGYWRFFPAEDGWGRIPAWGFAEVVAGEVEGLETGTRMFGYLPMAAHLLVEPTRVRGSGFTDASAHRRDLPAPYNAYRRTDADLLYSARTENLQTVLLPLFMTSFVLDDFLDDHAWFGAEQVVVSSASSKTAIGLAMLASRRESRPTVVALTSPGNVGFVDSLGCYDGVVTYGSLTQLDATRPTVYVDVAGDTDLRAHVHELFATALNYSCVVGMSHWDAPHGGHVTGVRPTEFFAPSQVEKRIGDWGPDGYRTRMAASWSTLVDGVQNWLAIEEVDGLGAAQHAYERLLAGRPDPRRASVVTMGG